MLHCMFSHQNGPSPETKPARLEVYFAEDWWVGKMIRFLKTSFLEANLLALFLGRGYAKFEHVQINKAAGNS